MPQSQDTADAELGWIGIPEDAGPDENAIYEQIHLAIARQDLSPGTRLREDHLRRIFGVSRARIRNVLTRLAYAGVVTLEPNRGASVTKPSPKDAHDNFVARRAVEDAIVRIAAGHIGPADRALLTANIEAESKARHDGDTAGMVWLSGEFHMLLARITGNRILEGILRELITREALVISTFERPGRPSCSHDEHHAILEALCAGDADRASRLMLGHLGNVEDRLDLDPPKKPADLAEIFGRHPTRV
ncbi:GntR family transcriptional regulator [Siculibacillus lacustris]|uniref:GntR family transcriptional regulator n=1 Tax=Siculibacillus lacustris TaxID=1549641 RepID=A0A4Q9VWM8_9HYPH|nr:GntR family transcriptional regulator [Siculibacillus lacustris]TBW40732.1 GntR family transcriptional regulator [Siculibacillus lacustris]